MVTKAANNGARGLSHQEAEPKDAAFKGLVTISAPNFRTIEAQIIGVSPLMVHRFSKKAEMQATHEAGSQVSKGKRVKPPRDFKADYEGARYKDAKKGWDGFNASSIRNGMVSACRATGTVMTRMKLAVFVEADGYDAEGVPLIRIYGEPQMDIRPARNDDGSIDLRCRPRYDEWHATLRVRYDADMMTFTDIANLLMRVGMQVGICEGRPDSKKSAGIGYGLFNVVGEVPK